VVDADSWHPEEPDAVDDAVPGVLAVMARKV
jgi:hypothetical protein